MSINFDFSDLDVPKDAPPPAPTGLSNERFIGGIILIVGLAVMLVFCISTDSKIIVPHNQSIQATKTASAPKK